MRTIVDIKGLAAREEFPWSENEIRKLLRRPDFPMPHKRLGKKILIDIEAVWKWYDRLPGKDFTFDE